MKNEYSDPFALFFSVLDTYKNGVDFGCNLMRVTLLEHAHSDGFKDWTPREPGHRLTGPETPELLTHRGNRILERYVHQYGNLEPMPGFYPVEPEKVLTETPA